MGLILLKTLWELEKEISRKKKKKKEDMSLYI